MFSFELINWTSILTILDYHLLNEPPHQNRSPNVIIPGFSNSHYQLDNNLVFIEHKAQTKKVKSKWKLDTFPATPETVHFNNFNF